MKSSNFYSIVFCFFSFVFSSYSCYYSDQEYKKDISDTETINPKPDYDAFSMHLRYPEIARRADIEGPMVIRIALDSNGRIRRYSYDISLGPLFEKAVDEALKYTTFTPEKRNGKAVSSTITMPVMFRLRGISKYSFNYHEQILFCLTALIKEDSKNKAEYYYLRGKEHFRNREYDYANEDYNEYTAIVTENQKLFYEDDILNSITNRLPKDTLTLDSLVKKGNVYTENYLFQQALDVYNLVLEKESNIHALQSRANLYSKCKMYSNSLSDYLRLIELNPKDSIAYLNAGWNYYLLGQMTESIEFSEKAILLSPKSYKAMYNKAIAYLRLNQIDSSRALYKKIKLMQGDNSPNVKKAAIADLKKLVHDNIMKDECRSILKDIFDQSREDIAWNW